jgi:hypothetical protein
LTRRLLRTIRLDGSDPVVFATPAEPGEWAVPGGFLWMGRPVESLGRKERIAFRSGFLGIDSFGFSTLAIVSDASPEERSAAVDALAARLVERLGAPDLETARPAAEEEIAFAAGLCEGHAVNTLVALHRTLDAGGEVREQFRTLRPRKETSLAGAHLRGHERAFSIVETDAGEPEDRVDLVDLLRERGQ